MKGKIKVVMLLSMLLLFLPTNVFAEDANKEAADLPIEATSLNDNESFENEKSEVSEEAGKNNSENNLEPKNQTETNKSQEIVEESENLLTEEDEEADTKTIEKQETIIEDDNQDDESELEISELQKPEAVGGGSGGSVCPESGCTNFIKGALYFKKIDDDGNPMGGVHSR